MNTKRYELLLLLLLLLLRASLFVNPIPPHDVPLMYHTPYGDPGYGDPQSAVSPSSATSYTELLYEHDTSYQQGFSAV